MESNNETISIEQAKNPQARTSIHGCWIVAHRTFYRSGEKCHSTFKIKWFYGITLQALTNTIKTAFSVEDEFYFEIYERHTGLSINLDPERLPTYIELDIHAEKRCSGLKVKNLTQKSRLNSVSAFKDQLYIDPAETEPLLSPYDDGPSPAFSETERFRMRMIFLERANAHLANERTYLAWIRTALCFLNAFLQFFLLGNSQQPVFYYLGGIFGAMIPVIAYTGYARFQRFECFLGMSYTDIRPFIGKTGLHEIFFTLSASICLACIALFFIGTDSIDGL